MWLHPCVKWSKDTKTMQHPDLQIKKPNRQQHRPHHASSFTPMAISHSRAAALGKNLWTNIHPHKSRLYMKVVTLSCSASSRWRKRNLNLKPRDTHGYKLRDWFPNIPVSHTGSPQDEQTLFHITHSSYKVAVMSRYSTLWLQGSRYEQVPWPRWPRQWIPIRRVCSLQQPQPVLLSELSKTATAWHTAFIPWDYWLHAESDTRGAPHAAVFRGLLATSVFPGLHLFGNITFEQLYLTFKIIPFSCMKHWKCTNFSLVCV